MTLLTACAGGITSWSGPPLVQYSEEFQIEAGRELEEIKVRYPNTTILVIDYGKLRDQVRAGNDEYDFGTEN